MITKELVLEALDMAIQTNETKVRAQVDAACCGTKSDFRRAHEAEELAQQAMEAAIKAINKLAAKRCPCVKFD